MEKQHVNGCKLHLILLALFSLKNFLVHNLELIKHKTVQNRILRLEHGIQDMAFMTGFKH